MSVEIRVCELRLRPSGAAVVDVVLEEDGQIYRESLMLPARQMRDVKTVADAFARVWRRLADNAARVDAAGMMKL